MPVNRVAWFALLFVSSYCVNNCVDSVTFKRLPVILRISVPHTEGVNTRTWKTRSTHPNAQGNPCAQRIVRRNIARMREWERDFFESSLFHLLKPPKRNP